MMRQSFKRRLEALEAALVVSDDVWVWTVFNHHPQALLRLGEPPDHARVAAAIERNAARYVDPEDDGDDDAQP